MTIITTQAEIQGAKTSDLVETYNHLTGKSIAKFESRAKAETQVKMAILAAVDKANHTSKNAPSADKPAVEVQKIPEGVSGKKAASAAKKAAAKPAKVPAKKVATVKAPKAEAAPRGRSATYTHVRLTAPETLRRPQADSMRTKVLNALQSLDSKMKSDKIPPAKRVISVDDLSKHVGFSARSFIHKLAFQGWCEVAAA
jgi:hypothetical protein